MPKKKDEKKEFLKYYTAWERNISGDKTSKCASGYGANPRGFSCSVCRHFLGNFSCAIVEGTIKPEDCCNLFDSPTFKPSSCKR